MGMDKCSIRTPDGTSIIATVAGKFRQLFNETILIANHPAPLEYLDLAVFPDAIPHVGSLGGIYTAVLKASNDRCFVAACDMPFLNEDLIQYMLSLPVDYDVLIPHPLKGYEPLHAIYRKTCLGPMKRLIDSGAQKIIQFFPEVIVAEIGPEILDRFDHTGLTFFNINSPEDLDQANRLWHRTNE